MREPEFLPSWYPQVRAWRQRLMLQASITAVAAAIALLWAQLAQGNIHARDDDYQQVRKQLAQARSQLTLLDEQTKLLGKLREQEQVEGRLGLAVDMTRLLGTLQEALPASMSLVELAVDTPEIRAFSGKAGSVETKTYRLVVNVVVIAPTDTEISAFFSRLIESGVFEKPQMKYTRRRGSDDNSLREAAVSLELPLDTPEAQ